MIFDAESMFSNAQKVTVTAASENVVAVPKNVGAGQPVYVSVHPVQAFAGLTSLTIEVQSAEKETGSWSTVAASGALSLAELNSGNVVNMGSVSPRSGQFMRLNYVVVGTATAGKLTAGLVLDRQTSGRV